MRVSRHNGRSGAHGAYNPKHNDREFDLDKAEEIKKELTSNNLYWDCITRKVIRHDERTAETPSFTEVEKGFYDLAYKDYVEGQNERNIAARHRERNRTTDDIRESPKTCPEETIYQIGNIDKHVDYDVLVKVTFDFLNQLQARYGEHMHILDWALHLDEGTPHIHERHVFDVINKYGERQPKQEEALKQMGFELPDPNAKPGKYNNRKMSFDAACRELFLESCKKYGLEIEEEPVYGGKKYLEKQEYIIEKLNADYKDIQEKFETVDALYSEALADNARLTAINEEMEKHIEDVDTILKEVSDIAYEKACETLIDEITDKVRDEDITEIEKYKKWLMAPERTDPQNMRNYALKHLDGLQTGLKMTRNKIINAVRKAFRIPEKKAEITKQIAEKAKPSVLAELRKIKEGISSSKKDVPGQSRAKGREESL